MLIESTAHLPISLAMFQDVFHAPGDGATVARIVLRWAHFVAGITWIGLLYFFNLVNVPFQKGIDADTKKKINPDLLGRALWYFRWGALVTVLVFAMVRDRPPLSAAPTGEEPAPAPVGMIQAWKQKRLSALARNTTVLAVNLINIDSLGADAVKETGEACRSINPRDSRRSTTP